MEHLRSIGVFVRAVELRSFAEAAKVLGLTPSAVSKSIGVLERSLNVRLLVRSTRGIALTDEGSRFFVRCQAIVTDVEAAEREITSSRSAVRGRLRVMLHFTPARARILAQLPTFLRVNPEIKLEIVLSSGAKSLDAEGIDVGVFIGDPPESNLVARRLADSQFLTCASHEYLREFGVPQVPEDLAHHNCLEYLRPDGRTLREFTYEKGEESRVVAVRSNFCINDGSALVEAALAGAGIARVMNLTAERYLGTGALVPVLTDWYCEGPPTHIMYARGRAISPKVRAFVQFVESLFVDVRPGLRLPPGARAMRRWPMYRG